ncbi:unnamed protein product [Malus baccata var. baccata]
MHITNSLHGFEKQKETNCFNVYVGEGTRVDVEAVGMVRLKLNTGFIMQLDSVLYVPTMRRSLISASKLVKQKYVFIGDDKCIKFFFKGSLIGKAFMFDHLWRLQCTLEVSHLQVLHVTTKRMHGFGHSFMLWRKRLAYVSKDQCPKSEHEANLMKSKPYASLVGSLKYANICTRPDLALIVGVLERFQSNPGEAHWVATKKVLRYLLRTKGHMLVYGKENSLELVGFTNSEVIEMKESPPVAMYLC